MVVGVEESAWINFNTTIAWKSKGAKKARTAKTSPVYSQLRPWHCLP